MLSSPFLLLHGYVRWRSILTFLFVIVFISATSSEANDAIGVDVSLNCDPCIQRAEYKIQAIYHGVRTDPFWLQVEASAKQMARDLNIRLNVKLYDEFDPNQMAQDIRNVMNLPMKSASRPDALIVTIPNDTVENAIRDVIKSHPNIPIFGCNSGYKVASSLGLKSFVSQDDFLAGVAAANEIIARFENEQSFRKLESVLFVNHEEGNVAIQDRLDGFRTTIESQTDGTVQVEELIINGKLDDTVLVENIRPIFTGCPYSVIQLATARVIDLAIDAFDGLFADCTGKSYIGTFDSSKTVYDGIIQRKVIVGVSQQQYLQGVLPVLFATLYVTTNQILYPPINEDDESTSNYSIYLSGPSILNLDNVPSDTVQICQDDAFPVCPNQLKLVGGDVPTENEISECDCFDRSEVRIGGVVHGIVADPFWDIIFSSAKQSANDMNVTLDMERYDNSMSGVSLHETMALKITNLCNENVDGIFVSIPTLENGILEALQWCSTLRVPIISINAGIRTSTAGASNTEVLEEGMSDFIDINSNETDTAAASTTTGSSSLPDLDSLVLQHIGQSEETAGYDAGIELIKAGVKKGWCINHEPNVEAVVSRCLGMKQAFDDDGTGTEFMGIINVTLFGGDADAITYQTIVEEQINDGDESGSLFGSATSSSSISPSWTNVGLLLTGAIQINIATSTLKVDHPDVVIGTFDIVNQDIDEFYSKLDSDELLFAIDQRPYLQGVLPVPLLTIYANTNNKLENNVLQTGPLFIYNSPSDDVQSCEANYYETCDKIDIAYYDDNDFLDGNARSGGGSILYLSEWVSMVATATTMLAVQSGGK